MPVLLRRLAFGVFWFAIFWMALSVIAGGLAGGVSGAKPPPGANLKQGYEHGRQAELVGSAEFRERYGTWVVVSAAALSAICTIAGLLPGTRKN